MQANVRLFNYTVVFFRYCTTKELAINSKYHMHLLSVAEARVRLRQMNRYEANNQPFKHEEQCWSSWTQ